MEAAREGAFGILWGPDANEASRRVAAIGWEHFPNTVCNRKVHQAKGTQTGTEREGTSDAFRGQKFGAAVRWVAAAWKEDFSDADRERNFGRARQNQKRAVQRYHCNAYR